MAAAARAALRAAQPEGRFRTWGKGQKEGKDSGNMQNSGIKEDAG